MAEVAWRRCRPLLVILGFGLAMVIGPMSRAAGAHPVPEDGQALDGVQDMEQMAPDSADWLEPASHTEALNQLALQPMANMQPAAANGRPIVYMTFDDGPNYGPTVDILNTLARHNAKATFFVTGNAVGRYPDVARRIVNDGHGIANHTVDHPQLTSLSDAGVLSQLQRTTQLVSDATGVRTTCYRPPYGATNARVHNLAVQSGLTNAGWTAGSTGHWGLWDVDTNDWRRGYTRTWNELQRVGAGDVVLMHSLNSFSSSIFSQWMAANGDRFEFRPLPGCGAWTEPSAPGDAARWYRYKVARLYLGYFLRMPRDSGAVYWNTQYVTGRSIPQISQVFARSAEFENRYGDLGPRQFVVQAFANTLGRRPEPAGAEYWSMRIASGELSRGQFMVQLTESAEFVRTSAQAVTAEAWNGDVADSYRRGIEMNILPEPELS